MPHSATRRLSAAAALAAVVVAGLAARLAPGNAATDILGDALYTVAVYAGVVVLTACRPLIAASVAAGWSVLVEVLQLTGLPRTAADVFPPAALVLGSSFDARDLIVYVAAALVTYGADAVAHALLARR